MALEKTCTAPNGVVDTYHRIASVTSNFEGETSSSIKVKSYVSGDVRRSGVELSVRETIVGVPGTGDRTWAYDQLKRQPAFADATDA